MLSKCCISEEGLFTAPLAKAAAEAAAADITVISLNLLHDWKISPALFPKAVCVSLCVCVCVCVCVIPAVGGLSPSRDRLVGGVTSCLAPGFMLSRVKGHRTPSVDS